MSINNITQNISTIPPAGHRGVDVQTVFVNKQEDFQDHLTDVTVAELNNLKTQMNTMSGEMNTTASQVNTTANTATTKASEASASASSASASATSASTSATSATTSRNQAETFAQQASASASSVDANNIVHRTNNETIAGVKTFSSSPIVPTPTTDFQATATRSTNITVNVGTGQTYTTINQALAYLSGFYPLHKTTGVTATVNLKAGFVMNEQVLVSGLNLGWITIVGEDAETIITHTALTTAFNGTHYPAFGVDKGGTSPVVGQLFRFNVEKVGGNKHGLVAYQASSASIEAGAGFIGAGAYGIYANGGSTINANSANASYAGAYGIYANGGSTINAIVLDASYAGTYGIYASGGSIISANNAKVQNQTTGERIRVIQGSHIIASAVNTSGGTATVLSQTANTLTASGIIYQ